jgi:hypothetical protein
MNDSYLSSKEPQNYSSNQVKSVIFPISESDEESLDHLYRNKSEQTLKGIHKENLLEKKESYSTEKINFGDIFEVNV